MIFPDTPPETRPPSKRNEPSGDELRAALAAAREALAAAADNAAACADLYVACVDLMRLAEARIRELEPNAEITPEMLTSVCLIVGPYRNLTTLTASVIGLHREAVVLNHAGRRTLRNPRLNFLADYTPEKFAEFVRYAGFAARGGARGMHGGDIRLSHAYDREAMREADAKVAGSRAGPVKCLVWKESQKVSNFLRSEQVDVRRLLEANAKLRFLLPVRNPIDCAISNLRSGHVQFFERYHGVSKSSSVEDVVIAILDEIATFAELRERSDPDRFFMYFEHEMGRAVLEKMLAFLGLPPDEGYLATAVDVFRPDRAPQKDPRPIALYAGEVERRFAQRPELRDALLEFVPH